MLVAGNGSIAVEKLIADKFSASIDGNVRDGCCLMARVSLMRRTSKCVLFVLSITEMPYPTSKPWKRLIYLIAGQATLRLAEVEAVLLSKQETPRSIVPESKRIT
jgi:hypothetical protein